MSQYVHRKSLGLSSGLSSFLIDHTIPQPQRARIESAWNWLVENNPLYSDLGPMAVDPSFGGRLEVNDRENQRSTLERQVLFPGTVIELTNQGPRAGDEPLEDVVAGIEMSSGQEVKYSDPDILVKIFPDLFPYGMGAFQLRHSSVNLRGQETDEDELVDGPDENDGSFSIKMYAKYRILHFDRSFAKNTHFVVSMHNWVRKAVVHGYRMRTTTRTRQGTATTASHVT